MISNRFLFSFVLTLVIVGISAGLGLSQDSIESSAIDSSMPVALLAVQTDDPTEDQKSDEPRSEEPGSPDKSQPSRSPDDKESDQDPQSNDDKSDEGEEEDGGNDGQKDSRGKRSIQTIREMFSRDSETTAKFSKRAPEFVSVFKPIIEPAAKSTVKVMSGKKQKALGIVVDTDGHILTKASELEGEVAVELPDGRRASATVLGIHPDTDLAMLTIKLDGLVPVHWGDDPTPAIGQWVATPNGEETLLDVGIVGVNARPIPQSSPFIGIVMLDVKEKNGVKITAVVADSPADEADLLVGDLIVAIDSVAVKDIKNLRNALGQYDPYDRITVTIKRAGKNVDIKLTLAERDKVSPANDRSNQQNRMGSELSRRRKDFPKAFQHDSMLTAKTCGGPVVNLDGEVVGINIARAGRVATLALPTETILPIIEQLKTGELAPQLVNKEKITNIDAELTEINSKLNKLPPKKNSLETQFQVEKAKQEELERILKDVQSRLKIIELKSKTLGTELESIERDLKNMEKVREKLQSERKQLATGVRE